MAFYEITFIARQELAEKDVEKIAEELAKFVKDNGGKVIKTENWGSRNFAYEMKKAKKGYYMFLGIELAAEPLKELGRKIRLNEDIVRHLTVRVKEISKDESPILSNEETGFDNLRFEA